MLKMDRFCTAVILLITCLGCKQLQKPTALILDYSWSSGWQYSFSLKVYDNGTTYLRKNDLRKDSLFVKNIDIKSLDKLLLKARNTKLDTAYIQDNIEDASSFYAIIYPEASHTKIYNVYGDNYPVILKQLEKQLRITSELKGWTYLKDTTIKFGSLHKTPTLKVDRVKFPPPTKEEMRTHGYN
jgi:hypothetical protein